MKKLINILNSLMIISSATVLTVACNKLKSLNPEDNTQKNHNIKDSKNNEENKDSDELEVIFKQLKKIKKLTADIIADNKNTIADLISELEQSEQIKSITKKVKFTISIEEKKEEILKSGNYPIKVILDEEHIVLINVEVVSINKILTKLDEKTKFEQIKTKLNEYLKTYDIEADGELRIIDVKFTILEKLKAIIKPYNIKFDNTDFKITNDYFQDDEDIIFLNEENQILTLNVDLNLTDPNLRTIVAKTNPIYTKNEKEVKETAISLKIENTRSQIQTKVNFEFNQNDDQIFNVVSDDNDTYEYLLKEIKQRISASIESDDIKLDNIKFKDSITLLDKIKSNQSLTVSYDLVYNNFFYELDSEKKEEINNNKTFEFQIKSIDNLETKVEKIITNSSFDKIFFDKTLLKEAADKDVVKKAEDYLYAVSKEIKAMKDKYKFDLIFTRDTSEGSFDHKFYNGKAAFKLKLKIKKATSTEFELKQAFYLKVYEEDESKTVDPLTFAKTDASDILNPIVSFGIREKIENILKTDETITKIQADGQNTFEDYINLVKISLNNNEQINDQYIVQDVQFTNPIYNNQSSDEKIVVKNQRLLIANNDKKEKYSLLIKLTDKINNNQIKLNFIDAINIEGLYNLFAVQEYENKKIKTKIKSIIDRIINNNLTVKVGEDTYQNLVDQLFNEFNNNFKMANLEVKKDNIIVDLIEGETLTSKISTLGHIKFKVDFGYINKYGEHIDKLTFNNNEINNLLGSDSREKIKEEFIQQLKQQILKLEQLDDSSFVYKELYTRANRNEKIEQLINELNEKFINILQLFKVNNTNYFDYKISFAADNKDLTNKDIVPNKPISLLLNVFNKDGSEIVINNLPFKIKIREANGSENIQEKADLLKQILKTATLDLSLFSDKNSDYIDNYPTWTKLLEDIQNSGSLKMAINEFINKNIESDKFKTIADFIDQFEFKVKNWSKITADSKNNYVINKDKQILTITITSLNQNLLNPITINTSVEVLLGEFSEDNFNKAIAKEIYLEVKNKFSAKVSIDNTDAVKPKDKKEYEDDIIYFDYKILKDKILKFIKSKLSLSLQRKKQQYHLTDNDINFDFKIDNSLTDNLEHKDDDLVRYTDTLNFILSIKVKTSTFNALDNETSEKFTITINNNDGYIDAQIGLDKLEQDKFEKLKEVILKLLTKDNNSSTNEYDLKEQHYNVDGKSLAYEYDKFETKKNVKEYFQTLIDKIKKDLLSNETLKNWKINLDDYNISLDYDKKFNLNLNTDMFSEPNYVVLTVESKTNNKLLEDKIKYMPKNKEEYDKHIKVNELVNKIKDVFRYDPEEFQLFWNKFNYYENTNNNLDWKFIIQPESSLEKIRYKRFENLKNYFSQIKNILRGNDVKIEFEVNSDGAISDLKESVTDKKYKVNFPIIDTSYKDIKILLNIKINGRLFEKQETIMSSSNIEDWQNALIWYFNNNRVERNSKKFDEIADAMSRKGLKSLFDEIDELIGQINEKSINEEYKISYDKLSVMATEKMKKNEMSKKDYNEIREFLHKEFEFIRFNREEYLKEFFDYFPALKNGEFTVTQKNPSDPTKPLIDLLQYLLDYSKLLL